MVCLQGWEDFSRVTYEILNWHHVCLQRWDDFPVLMSEILTWHYVVCRDEKMCLCWSVRFLLCIMLSAGMRRCACVSPWDFELASCCLFAGMRYAYVNQWILSWQHVVCLQWWDVPLLVSEILSWHCVVCLQRWKDFPALMGEILSFHHILCLQGW